MSENKDELMSHNYDGIQEYDNPMPRWWTSTFILTSVFAVLYVFGITFGQIDGYQEDMQQDNAVNEKKRQAVAAANPPIDAKMLDEKIHDPASVKEGALVFAANCASCHAPDGGGLIGPNLTDNAFLYGKKPEEAHKVIRDGTAKGMPPWGAILSQSDMVNVISFIVSIRGTTPEKPKKPQGEVIE